MLIAGTDIETTGLEPGDHRIIEVYTGIWDLGSRSQVDEYFQRIHPQRSIAVDAQRVHGISLADLEGCPVWDDMARDFAKSLNRADLIVGHNLIQFDMPFIGYELKRVGLAPVERPLFDTMNARWATVNGKLPTLAELCFACGVDYDPAQAHKADYDVGVMMKAFFNALDWGWFQIGETVREAA